MAAPLAVPEASEASGPETDPDVNPPRGWRLRTLALAALGGLIILALAKTFLVQAFFIPSGSMEPTLHGCAGCDYDRVLVDRMSARTGSIERGDVVVFRDSQGWVRDPATRPSALQAWLSFVGLAAGDPGQHLVKRVIGVDGDRVEARHGQLYVNGVRLKEPYVVGESSSTTDFSVTVPEDSLWVMGDDRDASADSRAHVNDPGGGFVPESDVVGRVFAIVWPLQRGGTLDRPATFDQVGLDEHE